MVLRIIFSSVFIFACTGYADSSEGQRVTEPDFAGTYNYVMPALSMKGRSLIHEHGHAIHELKVTQDGQMLVKVDVSPNHTMLTPAMTEIFEGPGEFVPPTRQQGYTYYHGQFQNYDVLIAVKKGSTGRTDEIGIFWMRDGSLEMIPGVGYLVPESRRSILENFAEPLVRSWNSQLFDPREQRPKPPPNKLKFVH